MSADNGIYILECKDQYRVIEAQAIENLFYDLFSNGSTNRLIPTRVVEYFGRSKYTRNKDLALRIAQSMEKRNYTEYGVKTFTYGKTWKHILEDAKKLAPLEIEVLKKRDNRNWDWEIKRLEEIINM